MPFVSVLTLATFGRSHVKVEDVGQQIRASRVPDGLNLLVRRHLRLFLLRRGVRIPNLGVRRLVGSPLVALLLTLGLIQGVVREEALPLLHEFSIACLFGRGLKKSLPA